MSSLSQSRTNVSYFQNIKNLLLMITCPFQDIIDVAIAPIKISVKTALRTFSTKNIAKHSSTEK